jgi:REP element-mobilizing transposase RayT
MEAYKRSSHAVWDCKYLVWVTKYRFNEMWAEYIKNQTPPEPDDSFNMI